MDHTEQSAALREHLTSAQRVAKTYLGIDPGLVHHRKIETVLGQQGMAVIDRQIQKLPELPDWQRSIRVDHIYARTMVGFCDINGVPTLSDVLASEKGRLFCSTEQVEPCPDIFDKPRVASTIALPGASRCQVELHYTSNRVTSDTVKSHLYQGHELSLIAELSAKRNDVLEFEPLVIGAPWLTSEDEVLPTSEAVWWSHSYGEVFIEDIDELAAAQEAPGDGWRAMATISESAFKTCLAEILDVDPANDWGGEQSDLYSGHVRLAGQRHSAAFLLKGPARFSPMTLNHLGKNNDQIVRLAHEPADLLVVQHCHEIGSAVRETLRAFAIQPGRVEKRYCFIDGKDSYRILTAYGKLDRAKELSAE